MQTGERYFNAGGGTSVGENYAGLFSEKVSVALEHGMRLSDVLHTWEHGDLDTLLCGNLTILPSVEVSVPAAVDFNASLALASTAWDGGLRWEAAGEYLYAAIAIPPLVGAALRSRAVANGTDSAVSTKRRTRPRYGATRLKSNSIASEEIRCAREFGSDKVRRSSMEGVLS